MLGAARALVELEAADPVLMVAAELGKPLEHGVDLAAADPVAEHVGGDGDPDRRPRRPIGRHHTAVSITVWPYQNAVAEGVNVGPAYLNAPALESVMGEN